MISYRDKSKCDITMVDSLTGQTIATWDHPYVPETIGTVIEFVDITDPNNRKLFKLVGIKTSHEVRSELPSNGLEYGVMFSSIAKIQLIVIRYDDTSVFPGSDLKEQNMEQQHE